MHGTSFSTRFVVDGRCEATTCEPCERLASRVAYHNLYPREREREREIFYTIGRERESHSVLNYTIEREGEIQIDFSNSVAILALPLGRVPSFAALILGRVPSLAALDGFGYLHKQGNPSDGLPARLGRSPDPRKVRAVLRSSGQS